MAAGRWVPPQPGHVLEAALRSPPRVFAGARLALHGPPGIVQPFRLTLEHAGASTACRAPAPAKSQQTCRVAGQSMAQPPSVL